MPSYDYVCKECGNVEERFCSIKDSVQELECMCGGIKIKTTLQAPGFRTNFVVGLTKSPLKYYGREALAKPSSFLDD